MAYVPATAAPYIISQDIAGANKLWRYDSADTAATVDTAGYITDAKKRGMTVGDLVLVTVTGTTVVTTHRVMSINATTGAADLSDGTALTTSTNTD